LTKEISRQGEENKMPIKNYIQRLYSFLGTEEEISPFFTQNNNGYLQNKPQVSYG
jgi:hypothetical protein